MEFTGRRSMAAPSPQLHNPLHWHIFESNGHGLELVEVLAVGEGGVLPVLGHVHLPGAI